MSDMEIQRMGEQGTGGTGVVAISGRMTIEHADEIKSALIEAFAAGGGLCLDLAGVTEVDLTGLQLICAAHMSSIRDNKSFSVDTAANESIKSIVRDAGFLRHIGCSIDTSKTCVWTGGES